MRVGTRIVIATVLLVSLTGLCIHYGATYDDNWPHPTGDQLQDDYDEFTNDQHVVFGDVQSTTDDTIGIRVTDSADEVAAELEVHDIDHPVDPGSTVQVSGELASDRTMTADELVVVDQGETAFHYKLATSVLGIALAIGYFVRYWRPDLHELGFEPRREQPTDAEGSHDG